MPNPFPFLIQILQVEVRCSNLSLHLTDHFSLLPAKAGAACHLSHQKYLSPNTHDPRFLKNSNEALTYMCVLFPLSTIFLPVKYSSASLERWIQEFFFLPSIHLFIKSRHLFLFGHVNRKGWVLGTVSKPDSSGKKLGMQGN